MKFADWQQQQAVADFLHHEARLLDERRWDEWLALFTPDGLYWVPLVEGQASPDDHASLFREDALLRSMRARRLAQPRAYSQQPPTRTAHVIGNILLDAVDGDALVVASTFHLVEARRGEQRLFAGSVRHTLVPDSGGYRIRLKRVDLVDCDAPHEGLQVFL